MTAFGIRLRRIARTFTSILIGWNVAGAAWAAAPVIDAIDWHRADVDLSFLNRGERPAGKRGFVHARRDMLVFGDGTQARFWGINITAATLFATDRAAVKEHSHRLSQLGFNLVRLHHHDSYWVQPNVFGVGPAHDTRNLDPAMLEKIDWWIKCLKDEGIYVWLDLHVQRQLVAGDGIAAFDDMARGRGAVEFKGFNYVDDDIERAMKAFNEAYLGHVNAHTGLSYKDDPAVAAVLVTNENDITEHYGNALLPNQNVPKHNARYMAEARAFARTHDLPEGRVWRSWEMGASKQFLNDLEQRFDARMIAHLRGIGVKVPIVTTSLWGVQMSSLPALTSGDMIDVHTYEYDGILERDPHAAGTPPHVVAAAQVSGMPLSVSEWNMGRFPSADRQDLPIVIAATASHQGWVALMHYAYSQTALQQAATASNWHAFNDPARLAMLPAAALLYRQRHVREATTTYVWAPTPAELFDADLTAARAVTLRLASERGRLLTVLPQVRALPWLRPASAPSAAVNVDQIQHAPHDDSAAAGATDTGEVRRDWKAGLFSVDTPRSQATVGRIGGRIVTLADVTVRMATPHAAVAVQALDDESIAASGDILVSVASPSNPTQGSQLPYMSEPTIGDVEIRSKPGLKTADRPGVQVKYEGGKYLVHFDGKAAVHWVSLRHPSKGG